MRRFGLELAPEQEEVWEIGRELAKDFASRAFQHDQERSLPVENFARIRDAGLFGIALPRDLGGLGVGAVGYCLFAEAIAGGCASSALGFNMHANATGGAVSHPQVPRERLEQVARLAIEERQLMCTAVSEPASSSLQIVSHIPLIEARKANGGRRLYGRKNFTSIVEGSDYCYMYARPGEASGRAAAMCVLVPLHQEGIAISDIWDTMGMRGTRSQLVEYDGAFIPEDLVLYQTDDFVTDFIFREAPWAFGGYTACYLGIGRAIVEWGKEHLSTRRAKGYAQVQGYAPEISRRYGEMVCEIEAATLMVHRAAWLSDTIGASAESFRVWLEAKHAVGAALQRISANAMVAYGLHSLFRSRGLELKLRDAATGPIMPPNIDACAIQTALLTLGLDPVEAPGLRLEETPTPVAWTGS